MVQDLTYKGYELICEFSADRRAGIWYTNWETLAKQIEEEDREDENEDYGETYTVDEELDMGEVVSHEELRKKEASCDDEACTEWLVNLSLETLGS